MAGWVFVVDDDMTNLLAAGNILSQNNIRVTAIKSGKKLLSHLKNNKPDLILLDILMPEMDGFETYEKLREQEKDRDEEETPVIFLTADEDKNSENRALQLGAVDYIHKPLNEEVLLKRISNVLENTSKIKELINDATIDGLTGFLNKSAVNEKLLSVCKDTDGALMILDIDNFKKVNDLYGHDKGDLVLKAFSDIIKTNTREQDIIGRIGGDEFVIFLKNFKGENGISSLNDRINQQLAVKMHELVGDTLPFNTGVSIGVSFIPNDGRDYDLLFRKADTALYQVKQHGKHGYNIFSDSMEQVIEYDVASKDEIERISNLLKENETYNSALWIGQDAFSHIYRYMLLYIRSYNGTAYKVLFNATPVSSDMTKVEFTECMKKFGTFLSNSLRKSDVMMQNGINEFFLFLPDIDEQYIDSVIGRLITSWQKLDFSSKINVSYETEIISSDCENDGKRRSGDFSKK
ncbi:diguanylate cyclase (GGDEF) domain-containing protein [Butyrivibrio sp. ob235]|uniref:GGDEF domain-containing response regulator n=1 Tax=Butyrivibrio sp. ob235 TaxID=1761780 RepID=UPI0008ACAE30|nr:diguanylate cyclase [Butyrivibrio sp. ob235]SEK32088.1 diguanylate cyclase (GGDEF) domain-containing protein [Butyrivibrio sp. ob235]